MRIKPYWVLTIDARIICADVTIRVEVKNIAPSVDAENTTLPVALDEQHQLLTDGVSRLDPVISLPLTRYVYPISEPDDNNRIDLAYHNILIDIGEVPVAASETTQEGSHSLLKKKEGYSTTPIHNHEVCRIHRDLQFYSISGPPLRNLSIPRKIVEA